MIYKAWFVKTRNRILSVEEIDTATDVAGLLYDASNCQSIKHYLSDMQPIIDIHEIPFLHGTRSNPSYGFDIYLQADSIAEAAKLSEILKDLHVK